MSLIAIHQPNYLPWLGYFRKMALADTFVFLNDVQYSKNGYINRVQILHAGRPRWLTVPVSARLGEAIGAVGVADPNWARSHLGSLRNFYAGAPAFKSVWPGIQALYRDLPPGGLAVINEALIRRVCDGLALRMAFRHASEFDTGAAAADDRLIEIVRAIDPSGQYLSGRGGASYQDPEKFRAAGIGLAYTDFRHPEYAQQTDAFVPGLSILDAIFHLGWDGTRALIAA